jgi:peroxiredoxin
VERLPALLVWSKRTEPALRRGRMRRLIRFDAREIDVARRNLPLVRPRTLGWLAFVGLIAAALVLVSSYRTPGLDRRPGQVIPNFELVDARTGQINRALDYRGGLLVIVFVGTSCPVGDLYMPRLLDLALRYESRKVGFLGINSNESDSIEDVAEFARRSRVIFPILKDTANRVADQLLAERTCEALLIDDHGRLRYRGAIDDQYGLGKRRDQPVHHYLADAIDAVLSGQRVSLEMTRVVGCPIERPSPRRGGQAPSRPVAAVTKSISVREQRSLAPPATTGGLVTYARDVAPILHSRCAPCHRQGQVGPFSLLTYANARRWSASIAEVIADHRMPPWHADPRYGQFSNDRSLSERDRSTLLAWIEQGCTAGDLAATPKAPELPQGWSFGAPDLVFELPETFKVPAEGRLPIIHYRIPANLTEDVWVQAAEARPSDRAVVHHIFVYTEKHSSRRSGQKEKIFLAAYLPGDVLSVYPPGVAKKIPAGSDLVFEVHYTPIGMVRFDRSSVGIILSKTPPRHVAVTRGIAAHGLKIPPGASDHIERAQWNIKRDIYIISFSPHMHLRGKSFIYKATYPDGNVEVLLSVPGYDFGWQSVYRLVEPKALPKGTRVDCEAHYDNSSSNIANPDPTRTVIWGEQTDDEMMMGYVDYYEDTPIAPTSVSRAGGR